MADQAYDPKAWSEYYQTQGYDKATADFYAYGGGAGGGSSTSATAGSSTGYATAGYNSYGGSKLPDNSSFTPAPAYDPALWDPDALNQQSAYVPGGGKAASAAPKASGRRTTVIRKGGGKIWDDQTLVEWDPSWFRLFVGDCANDVTEKLLVDTFSKYPSFTKARVIKDRLSDKTKYGFIAFSDPEDFLKAWKEMDGKYVGSRPIRLTKASTNVRAVEIGNKKAKKFDKALKKGGMGAGERGRVL